MKALQLISIAITVAAVGLSLPARADQAIVSETVQNAVVTGNNNTVNQSNSTSITSSSRGNRDSSGIVVRTRQNADVFGNGNVVNQSNESRVGQSRYRNR
jgi:DNA repair ATPase RecN